MPKTVDTRKALRGRFESMQQSSATPKNKYRDGVVENCCMLSNLPRSAFLVSTVFGKVSSLHPTSFLMIFTLV